MDGWKLLYIITVVYQVFRLFYNGVRLRNDSVISRGPVSGDLLFEEYTRSGGKRAHRVVLLAGLAGANVIPPMDEARLIRIDERSMMFGGMELVSRGSGAKSPMDFFQQCWVCKAPIQGGRD